MGAESGIGAPQRAIGAILLLLMLLGAFALWVGVPAAVLWGLGKVLSDSTEHLIFGLIAVPLGMVLFGLLLAILNTAYLRVSGVPFTADDERECRPRLREPLDRIIGISAKICVIAFLGWLLFGSAGSTPAGP